MQTKTVSLSLPITNGTEKISALNIRKPMGGDLRGIKLVDLMSLEFNALATVTLRTSLTPISKDALDHLEGPDIVALGIAVLGFFETSEEPSPTMQ